jgi:type IV pilus assembly protein PilW
MHTPQHLHPHAQRVATRQGGFSLIEIMVGLVIGMATVIIMLQMLTNAEASKRTTSGGNDAQMNGSLSLYTMERDIRASGYGINAFNIVGCALSYTTTVDARAVTIPLGPVNINPQTPTTPAAGASLLPFADGNTDQVMVIAGNANGSAEGDPLVATSTATVYQISNETSYNVGDYVVVQSATRATPCNLTLDRITAINGVNLTVTPGKVGMPVGSIVYNLGSAPSIKAYAVRNGSLTVCDYLAYDCGRGTYAATTNALFQTVWVPVASNISSLRAQYGRDNSTVATGMVGVVSTFDQVTPGALEDTSTRTIQCGWARTMSLRLAVLSRSAAYSKDVLTPTIPSWTGAVVNTTTSPQTPAGDVFDLTAVDPDWQHYRYKALETEVPLRNAIWQGGQATYQGGSGC